MISWFFLGKCLSQSCWGPGICGERSHCGGTDYPGHPPGRTGPHSPTLLHWDPEGPFCTGQYQQKMPLSVQWNPRSKPSVYWNDMERFWIVLLFVSDCPEFEEWREDDQMSHVPTSSHCAPCDGERTVSIRKVPIWLLYQVFSSIPSK